MITGAELYDAKVLLPFNHNLTNIHGTENMAAVHFTTKLYIPCEPNTAKRHIESHVFCKVRPCANHIVYARFEVFKTFLCIFF